MRWLSVCRPLLLRLAALQRLLQLPLLVHLVQDVAAAHKLALDEDLRPGGWSQASSMVPLAFHACSSPGQALAQGPHPTDSRAALHHTRCQHLSHPPCPPPPHTHLRDSGPGGELLHALPHIRVCQHVAGAILHACRPRQASTSRRLIIRLLPCAAPPAAPPLLTAAGQASSPPLLLLLPHRRG